MVDNKSPFENLFNKPPSYSLLRVFGCLCFPHVCDFNKHKFDYRSIPCVFLGYSSAHLCYKCIDRIGKVYISNHVQFEEYVFRHSTKQSITAISFDTTDSCPVHPSSSGPYMVNIRVNRKLYAYFSF